MKHLAMEQQEEEVLEQEEVELTEVEKKMKQAEEIR